MKVLLTGPNLETMEKIAGIGTVAQLILKNHEVKNDYFKVGRDLDEERDFKWIVKQIKNLRRFRKLLKNNYDIIHINSCLSPIAILRDFTYIKLAKRKNNKIVLHIHGGKYLLNRNPGKIINYFTNKNYKRVSKIVVLSNVEKQNQQFKLYSSKVSILPNAIDERLILRIKPKKEKNSIIFLGRIDDNKGIREIYKALSYFSKIDFKFYLYGDGTLKEKYVSKFRETLKDKFFYGGIISGNKKWEILKKMEFFILPSKFEGLPMALLESMACGCIPIVTNVGSMGTVVKDNMNGFLLEENMLHSIISKLEYVLSLTSDQKRILGMSAIKTINSEYSSDHFYKSLNDVYKEMCYE